MGFVALSYYFIEIYMQSVIISTIIFFMTGISVAQNDKLSAVGGSGNDANKQLEKVNAIAEKITQNPFILMILPVVNIIFSIILIIILASLRNKKGASEKK